MCIAILCYNQMVRNIRSQMDGNIEPSPHSTEKKLKSQSIITKISMTVVSSTRQLHFIWPRCSSFCNRDHKQIQYVMSMIIHLDLT